jgi:hypothetical protein
MRSDHLIQGSTEQSVARVEALAKLMDGAFVIPGRHFEEALNAAKGVEPPDGPKTPLRKDGEF